MRDEMGIAKAYMDLYAKLASDPALVASMSVNLWVDYARLWQSSWMKMFGVESAPVAEPAKSDSRFKDQDWSANFLFDLIKQSYLISARHIQHAVAQVEGLPADSEKKVAFFTRQYVDALSPSNFLLTNPQVLRETVASGGQNLVRGLNNLLADIEKGGGELRISMTDENAFKLGENVATTPGKRGVRERPDAAHPVPAGDGAGAASGRWSSSRPGSTSTTSSTCARRTPSSAGRWARATPCSSSRGSTRTRKLAQKGFDDYMLEGRSPRSTRWRRRPASGR